MTVLFSLDLTKDCDQNIGLCYGVIKPSDHREWLEKSDTGLPFVKYATIFIYMASLKNIFPFGTKSINLTVQLFIDLYGILPKT